MAHYSKYLTYNAATLSATAIKYRLDNKPNATQEANLRAFGENIYDKVVDHFGMVYASSVFRAPAVNAKVGGAPSSGHLRGECGDLDGDAPNDRYTKIDNVELFKWVKDTLQFDQLIAEFEDNGAPRWSHIGYKTIGNRNQVLIATRNNRGQTVYLRYTDQLFNQIYRRSRAFTFGMQDSFVLPDIESEEDEFLSNEFDQEVLGNRDLDLSLGPVLDVSPVELIIPEPIIVLNEPEFEAPLLQPSGDSLHSPSLIQKPEPTVITVGDVKITIEKI